MVFMMTKSVILTCLYQDPRTERVTPADSRTVEGDLSSDELGQALRLGGSGLIWTV